MGTDPDGFPFVSRWKRDAQPITAASLSHPTRTIDAFDRDRDETQRGIGEGGGGGTKTIDDNDDVQGEMAHVDARRRAWTVEADARRSAETLFETRNVKEIRTIAERTEQDVERKQGELRQLVRRHKRNDETKEKRGKDTKMIERKRQWTTKRCQRNAHSERN